MDLVHSPCGCEHPWALSEPGTAAEAAKGQWPSPPSQENIWGQTDPNMVGKQFSGSPLCAFNANCGTWNAPAALLMVFGRHVTLWALSEEHRHLTASDLMAGTDVNSRLWWNCSNINRNKTCPCFAFSPQWGLMPFKVWFRFLAPFPHQTHMTSSSAGFVGGYRNFFPLCIPVDSPQCKSYPDIEVWPLAQTPPAQPELLQINRSPGFGCAQTWSWAPSAFTDFSLLMPVQKRCK